MRIANLTLCGAALIAGCGTLTPTEQAGVTAGVTVATVAAASNTTVAQIVADGQLFCAGSAGIFAVAGVSVTGKPAATVAAVCKAIDAIAVPVSPPTAAAAVPVV